METPKTYTAYDDKGDEIQSITAKDATEDINPDEIRQNAENVETIAQEQSKRIHTAIEDLRDEINDAIVVEGIKIDSLIDKAEDGIEKIDVESLNIDTLYALAVKKHDELQVKYNEAAESSAWSVAGVKSVK